MILLIDNYDSFVFNLERYLRELGCETNTVRNDRITVRDIQRLAPQAIVISPGPCSPQEAGVSIDVVRELGPHVPLLGVCLGHQAIAAAYGGQIVRSPRPTHGEASAIRHSGSGLFEGLPNPMTAARYHSLIAEEASLPPELIVTASTPDGLIMALQHRERQVYGVQFHPESILTTGGHSLLRNFLTLSGVATLAAEPPSERLLPIAATEDFYQQPIAEDVRRPW